MNSYFTHPLTPRGVIQQVTLPDGSIEVHKSFVEQCDKIEILNRKRQHPLSGQAAVSTEKA